MVPVILPSVLRLAITSSSVVLPAPDAPISASTRPGSAAPLMPFSSVRLPPPRSSGMSTVYVRSRHATVIGVNGSALVALSLATATAVASLPLLASASSFTRLLPMLKLDISNALSAVILEAIRFMNSTKKPRKPMPPHFHAPMVEMLSARIVSTPYDIPPQCSAGVAAHAAFVK